MPSTVSLYDGFMGRGRVSGHGEEVVTVYGRSFEVLATEHTVLRFPPPLVERASNASGFEFWWKMLEFVFGLPDPASFPALPTLPSGRGLDSLRRYVAAAEEMADSSLLNGEDSITVRPHDDGSGERVESAFSSKEITRGFTTLFRQFDSSDERAGFLQVQRILREANVAAADGLADERAAVLGAWGKARGRLRPHNLKVRVGQKLRDEGRMPNAIPGEDRDSPEMVISAYQYGDLIHWGAKSTHIESAESDPFAHALQRMDFLEAAVGLTHVYLGFALVVQAALGDLRSDHP